MAVNLWTRDELILAFNLYLKLPFGKMHRGNSEIIHLADIINRTPSSVAIRLTNFASLDPYHQKRGVKGMTGGKKQCEPIWNEFISNKENLVFESEKILAKKENTTLESKYAGILKGTEGLKGETKVREVKTRVNQNVFREIVLANYSCKCAISGIDIPELLAASHIIPWSKNEVERLNPENGICLSSLYDKAYDKGLIGIDNKFRIILSTELRKKSKKEYFNQFFAHLDGGKLLQPKRYSPHKDFLQYHLDMIFRG